MKKVALVGTLCLIIDQIIKLIITNNMELNQSLNIIKSFFSITYVRNYGAAFSILTGSTFFLICTTIMALAFIYFIFIKNEKNSSLQFILYGILFGGIIGNLIDRVIYGYVVDYLDFNIFGFNAPIFNFADICIVVSIILIVSITLKESLNGTNRKWRR